MVRDNNLNGFSFAEAVKGMTLLLSQTPAKISLESLESAHLFDDRVSLDFFHGLNLERFKTFYAPAFFPEDQYEYKIEDGNPNRLKRQEKGNRFTVIAKGVEGQKINQALVNMSKHLCDSKGLSQK